MWVFDDSGRSQGWECHFDGWGLLLLTAGDHVFLCVYNSGWKVCWDLFLKGCSSCFIFFYSCSWNVQLLVLTERKHKPKAHIRCTCAQFCREKQTCRMHSAVQSQVCVHACVQECPMALCVLFVCLGWVPAWYRELVYKWCMCDPDLIVWLLWVWRAVKVMLLLWIINLLEEKKRHVVSNCPHMLSCCSVSHTLHFVHQTCSALQTKHRIFGFILRMSSFDSTSQPESEAPLSGNACRCTNMTVLSRLTRGEDEVRCIWSSVIVMRVIWELLDCLIMYLLCPSASCIFMLLF